MKLHYALIITAVILGNRVLTPSAEAGDSIIPIAGAPTPTPTPAVATPTPTPGLPRQSGLSNNQKAIYNLIQGRRFNHRATRLITALRSSTNLRRDLDLISPAGNTSTFQLGVSLAQLQAWNVMRRLDDIRWGAGNAGAPGASGPSGPSFSDSLSLGGPAGVDGKDGKSVSPSVPDNRWGFFLTGVGDFTNIGSHDGYDLTAGGVTLGIDYKLTPNLAIGFMAGYTGTSIDLPNSGRMLVNSGTAGLYGTYFQGGFYADTAVAGGYNNYDSRRAAFGGDARGDTDGGQLNVLFATGYDFKFGNLRIGPTGAFQYTNVDLDGYTEHGSLAPLNYGSQSTDSLTSAFGAKMTYDWKVGGITVRPELRAAWQHEYGDQDYEINSTIASLGGGSFTAHGPEIGRDSLTVGAGFAIEWNERVSTYLYYDGELGRENYTSQNVSGGIRVNF